MSHLSVPKQRSPRLSPSPPPPSSLTTIDAAEERKQCLEWLTVPLKRGDIYYVIDVTWFKQWCHYAGYNMDKPEEIADHSGIRPGPIDNIQLILDTPWLELKPGLLEHEHYELVHSRVWQLLVSWYGVSRSNNNPYNNDGHTIAIPRQVVVRGLRQQEVVEVYPSFFGIYYVDPAHPMETTPVPPTIISNLHHYQAGDGRWVYVFSQYSSLQDILDTFSIIVTGQQPTSKPEGRVWRRIPKDGKDDLPDADDWKLVPSTDVTSNKIEFLELTNGTDLLLEWKNNDGKYQRTGQVLAGRTWGQFQINDEIDAMDTQKKWFESTIRDVKEGKVFVHFKGWTTRWDEWIPTTGPGSERLAPKNTYTSGPFEPKGDATTSRLQRQNSVGAPPERGAVGLRNLGNTCFMNSTLQCLSNTPGLTEYFADNRHLAEINRDNPLGWQGKVAEEYGLLINDIWSGQYRTVTPSGFKRVIGEFQPRFSGYQQHDSSELLSFLLDGLHEDLNRVIKKPPTSAVESNGRSDAIVAAEAWDRHLLRNRSVIVDLCQGQLKSRVVCPDCKKESITFDPFMFLSVPLPHAGHHRQSITFIRMASTINPHPLPPTKYHLKLNKQSNVSEMRQVLAKEANLPSNYNLNGLLVVEVINNKISRFMNEQTMVSSIRPDDNIVVYDLPIFGSAWVKAREPGISQAEIKQTEIVVHKGQSFRRDGKNIVPIGPQFILPLQTVQLSTMPVVLLRRLVRDAISPFVRDGFHSDDEDTSLYTIHIANKDASQLIAEVPHDSATVDLQAATANHSYTLALVWNDTSRFIAEPVDVNGASDVPIKKGVDVYDCIQAFSQEETLRQSEAWYCSNCKQHKCATKKFDLWRLPDILIIHLKRFSYNKYFRDKLDTMIDFPVEGLDLHKWCPNSDEEKSSVYDLYAVSNHFGGLGGGHYTAYAKNLVDKRWYNLDDSSVSPITDVNRVKTAAAYVLFYHRRQPQQSSYSKSRSAT